MVTQELAVHSGRDTLGRRLRDGVSYLVYEVNRKPVVIKVAVDADTDTALVIYDGMRQRVDEMDPGVRFVEVVRSSILSALIDSDPNTNTALNEIETMLRRAADARRTLADVESWLCALLGVTPGDGFNESEMVTQAVRDGLGSSLDLLQLVRE